jgi:hypothetical protein
VKGVIFDVVEEAVTAAHGEEGWDALLEEAGVEGAYTALGDYPDSELTALVAAGSRLHGVAPEELTRWLGHQALLGLAARHPHFFAPHADTRSFLLTLNDVIHPEVRKLDAHAEPPHFAFADRPDGALAVTYRSQRRLCALAVGMIHGAATHFGEQVRTTQAECMHQGAEACVLLCTFDTGPGDGAARG